MLVASEMLLPLETQSQAQVGLLKGVPDFELLEGSQRRGVLRVGG